MKYANSGFGQTNYSLWDEIEEEELVEEKEDDYEVTIQLDSHMEEIQEHQTLPV